MTSRRSDPIYSRRDFTPGPCYLPPDYPTLSREELEAATERAAIMAGGPAFSEKFKRDAYRKTMTIHGPLSREELVKLREAFRKQYEANFAPWRLQILPGPSPWLGRLQWVGLGVLIGYLIAVVVTGFSGAAL